MKQKSIDLSAFSIIIYGYMFNDYGSWQYNLSWIVAGTWLIREVCLLINKI